MDFLKQFFNKGLEEKMQLLIVIVYGY